MTHRQAVWLLVAATVMWSIAGVVSRHLQAARGFEVTFWRAAFCVLSLLVLLPALRGRAYIARSLREGGRTLWLSGLCWSVMFTAFMLALTMTRVANVLVTMSMGPLMTALGARIALGHRLAPRTWGAIALAGIGIAWMYGSEVGGGDARQVLGTLVAVCVPVAAAVNWVLLQHLQSTAAAQEKPPEMLVAVLIGGLISAAVTLPLAWPFAATPRDLGLLALLGCVQLATPCLMAVAAARVLSGPEMSLLGLIEVLLGVLWAWLGAGEAPGPSVLGGGALVLLALVGNEVLAMRRPRLQSA